MSVKILPTRIGASVYFDVIEDLCYCKNVKDLNLIMILLTGGFSLTVLQFYCTTALYIHQYPSIACSLQMKEDYKNFKLLFIKINYVQYKWYVCGDFKCSDFCWVYRVDTPSIVAFCAFGIVEMTVSTTRKFIGRQEKN